jgi:UDP-N-acetylglucosamine:LPS N-acetylglucosamine transferase
MGATEYVAKAGGARHSPFALERRPKILAFYSRGGGGHLAAAQAVRGYLGNRYEIDLVNPFDEVLSALDPLRRLTRGRLTGEDFYNLCLKWGLHGLASWFALRWGAPRIRRWAAEIEAVVQPYLEARRPDLFLSLVPLINAPLLRVAERLGIPFLIVTTDIDTRMWVNGLAPPYWDRFVYTLPFADPAVREKIAAAAIPEAQVVVLGYPVRPGFLDAADGRGVREELGVPAHKPVVMVLMGGAGANAIYRYAREIARLRIPLHVLFCVGRNARLGERISRLPLAGEVTSTVVGYTERIPDLMAASDLLLTKPGPASISEAIYRGLPMLVDHTSGVLRWEELNLALVRENGLGEVVERYADAPGQISRLLADSGGAQRMRDRLAAFPREDPRARMRALVERMLEKG